MIIRDTSKAINAKTKKIVCISSLCDENGKVNITTKEKKNFICVCCCSPVYPLSRSRKNALKPNIEHYQHRGDKSKQSKDCDMSYYSAFRSSAKHIINKNNHLHIRVKKEEKIFLTHLKVLKGQSTFDFTGCYENEKIYIRLSYHPDRPQLEEPQANKIIELIINDEFCSDLTLRHLGDEIEKIHLKFIEFSLGRRTINIDL